MIGVIFKYDDEEWTILESWGDVEALDYVYESWGIWSILDFSQEGYWNGKPYDTLVLSGDESVDYVEGTIVATEFDVHGFWTHGIDGSEYDEELEYRFFVVIQPKDYEQKKMERVIEAAERLGKLIEA